MRTIRASEIGAFLYCQRSWWYLKRGEPSENQAELEGGTELHAQHGQQVIRIGCLRWVALALLVAALALAVAALTRQLLVG